MKDYNFNKIRLVNSILAADNRAATISQQAIALSAFSFIIKRRDSKMIQNRLMIEMPPGTGKSLVIALLVGLV